MPAHFSANLLRQLTGYGLNPLDWRIHKISENRVALENVADSDFRIIAQVSKHALFGLQLRSLRLVSL